MEALIGAVSALIVVTIDRQFERRHAKQSWLRTEALAAIADLVTAYYQVKTTLVGFGGHRAADQDTLSERLVEVYDGGGQKFNAARSRIWLLDEPDVIEATEALNHHLDVCFNATYDPEMSLRRWRELLYSDEALIDSFVATCRRRIDTPDLGRPISAFKLDQVRREDLVRPVDNDD